MPINGYQMWPKTSFTPVLPPLEKRKLGRPKMARRRDPSEYINPKDPSKLRRIGQNSVFCKKCGKHGHNRRTCTYDEDEEDRGTINEEDRGTVHVGDRGRVRGTTNVVGRGRGRGSSNAVPRGRGRYSTSEAGNQSPAASDPAYSRRVARGRKVRDQNPARMSCSQPVVVVGGGGGGGVRYKAQELSREEALVAGFNGEIMRYA
ncbi:hypothetical protein Vadar_010363 [Vaccinium darrowii]|uniref:Uncharacterized protein n=1 Tax=Vaccinium darrowii TaxID=229202 RepID=A0ACB7YL56_9ERIC|nr:hypothetical protein Vadar_010363 [Vaccinium darrowii]